jgi:hypothetical protein
MAGNNVGRKMGDGMHQLRIRRGSSQDSAGSNLVASTVP